MTTGPSLFDAYLAGTAGEFFEGAPASALDRKRAVERAAARPLAEPVRAALAAQNARLGPSSARTAQLAALAGGAAAVVTGQQVGLFLGPLYTLYKAASAVRVARALAAESGSKVVPVFWLQTEDHDLPEIAGCAIPRAQQGPLALEVPASSENRVSIAHVALPGEVDACVAALQAELGNLPHARAHLERLARHYTRGAGFGQAFAAVLAELFEPEGLLLLDPRDAAFASGSSAVHQRALRQARAIADGLLARAAELERAGHVPAVHVREDAPLSFFHAGGREAPRHRLTLGAQGFSEVGGEGSYSEAALLAALARDPLCFSTSALLRPILQDTLLPTAAYVGGPGEIAYFAQMAPLYAAFDMQMPLIVPRARFVVLEASTQKLLAKLGLRAADAAQGEGALLAKLAGTPAVAGQPAALGPDALRDTLLAAFESALRGALERAGGIASQLATPVEKTREKVTQAVSTFAGKYADALARADQARVHDVQRLLTLLQPHGMPQERYYGLPYFAARYGERAFLERVLEAIDPFDPGVKELAL